MAYEELQSFSWLHKIETLSEPLSIVITNHLFVEYALNHLIESNCKNYTKILNDNNRWTFSMKLELCYQLDLIEEYLYLNISKLNKIRNEYSHNLEVNFRDMDLNFYDPKGRVNLAKWKNKEIMEKNPTNKDVKDAVIWIGTLTFVELHNKIVGRDQLNIKTP